MANRSTFSSILSMKCPRCHEGNVFVSGNAYNLKQTTNMHRSCPRCGLSYHPEPGFYFGASYVSYGAAVGIAVMTVAGLFPWLGWNHVEIYLTVVGTLIVLLTPVIFRYSRVIWLHIFNSYDPGAVTGNKL